MVVTSARWHPGQDFGCCCRAERLVNARVGRLVVRFEQVQEEADGWWWPDYVNHYYNGQGSGVILRRIGNINDIISGYRIQAAIPLGRQIAAQAQEVPGQDFVYDFYNTYNLQGIDFSIGDTTIGGVARGGSEIQDGYLYVFGEIDFYLRDEFSDPVDVGKEVIDPAATFDDNVSVPLEQKLRRRLGLTPMMGVPRRGALPESLIP